MITHKTFTTNPVGLTSKSTLSNKENLREKAEDFLNKNVSPDDIIFISETISIFMPFSITVWYRRRTEI